MEAISARGGKARMEKEEKKKKKKERRNACLLHIKDDEKNIRGDGVEEDEVAGHR